VLVHGSDAVTYAAETSLMADQVGGEVDHPLLEKYFDDFQGNRYVRNNTPWSS